MRVLTERVAADAAASAGAKVLIPEGEALLVAVRNGEVVAQTADVALSHTRLAQKAFGSTTLPEGAWIGTVGKVGGRINALNSKSFYGSQGAAPGEITDLMRSLFRYALDMDQARRNELRASLERDFQSESDQHGFNQSDRIYWLAERVDEYLERWLGFCRISDATMAQLVDSVLFGMVEIGSEVLGEELKKAELPPEHNAAWLGFQATMKLVRDANRHDMENLRDAFSAWRTMISSTAT